MGIKRDSFVFYRSFYEAIKNFDDETRLALYDAVLNFAIEGEEIELDGIAKSIFTLIKPQLIANNRRYMNGCKGAEHGAKGGRPKKNKDVDSSENPIADNIENPIAVIDKNPIGDILETPIGDIEKTPKGDILENPKGVIKKTPKITPNENENVNVNVNDNENVIERVYREKNRDDEETLSKDSNEPPTLNDVKLECLEQHYTCDPVVFYNFNASKGWMIGNNKMHDWKSALATWDAREKQDRKMQKQRGGARNFIEFPQNAYDYDELEEQLLDN